MNTEQPKQEIQVSAFIAIQGATITRNALVIDEGASEDQLSRIGAALVGIEGARSWWIGDYGVTLTDRKGEHYTAGRAEALGIDDGSFRAYVSVARFFKPCIRVYDSLTFSHYRAAQDGCDGDLAVAQNWLEKAAAESWSVSQLRKAINVSKASLRNDASEAEENQFDWMDRADKWATTKRDVIDGIDADTARNLLEVRWIGVVELIDKLKEKARAQ